MVSCLVSKSQNSTIYVHEGYTGLIRMSANNGYIPNLLRVVLLAQGRAMMVGYGNNIE